MSTLPNWVLGKGAPGAKNIRKLGAGPPKYGGLQGGVAKFRRSVAFRAVAWCATSPLYLFGSFVSPFPNWVLGMGVSGAKNIREFGGGPPKYGGFQGGVAKFKRSVTLRSAPWRSVVFRCEAFCSVVAYPPPFQTWRWGGGNPDPRNLFLKSGRDLPNYDGFQRCVSGSRCTVALRSVPWRRA